MKKEQKIEVVPDGEITMGFDRNMIELRIDQIIPIKMLAHNLRKSSKFKQILSSVQEIGIIEPPVVIPDNKSNDLFILLDGHMRIEALKKLEITKVFCLVSTDDEAFTYNKHVNRIAPVQEHRMICRAVERGVSEEKIAKALNLDVKSIISKQKLLDGICEEVSDMLKDKMIARGVFKQLKRMKPYRQIEAVTLMNDAGIYTVSYARALLAATPKDQLVHADKPKRVRGLDSDQMARMESEMASLEHEYKLIEEDYGTDVLNLTLAKGYLSSLLKNSRIASYLAKYHPEMLLEFQKITEITSLCNGVAV